MKTFTLQKHSNSVLAHEVCLLVGYLKFLRVLCDEVLLNFYLPLKTVLVEQETFYLLPDVFDVEQPDFERAL